MTVEPPIENPNSISNRRYQQAAMVSAGIVSQFPILPCEVVLEYWCGEKYVQPAGAVAWQVESSPNPNLICRIG